MISVIISTYRAHYLEAISKNIAETIGVEFEIVAIDNSKGKLGLCKAYNIGAERAKYPILCFAHEDIHIKTENWGKIIKQLFKDITKLGLVGIVGSAYKTKVPSGWTYENLGFKSIYANYIQSSENNKEGAIKHYVNHNNENLSKVAIIDGLWFCTKKEVIQEYPFDEKTFQGFHCYDVDISLSVGQKYDVAVSYEVSIEHFSYGSYNKQWVEETLKLHKKWGEQLPINIVGYSKSEQRIEEEKAFYCFANQMLKQQYSKISIYKLLWSKDIRTLFTLKTFLYLNLRLSSL